MRKFTLLSFVFTIIAATSVLASAAPAGACSCSGVDDATAFAEADAVFIAQVSRMHPARDGGDNEVAIVEVSDVFKGDVDRLQGVATSTDTDCGYHLDGEEIYLIFATRDGLLDLEDGFYEVNLCGGSRPLTDSDLGFEATAVAPTDAGPPSIADIQAQLGDPRSSLFPEALIFVGVLGFILGLAGWFSRKGRPAT